MLNQLGLIGKFKLSKDQTKNIYLHISILVIICILYWLCFTMDNDSFTKKDMDIFDATYYAITTHTTLGFGDISPTKPLSRFLTMIHSLGVFFLLLG